MPAFLRSKTFKLSLFAFIFMGCGILIGSFLISEVDANKPTSHYEKIGVLLKVLNYVENNYVDEVNIDELTTGAINGMLSTLDPHTNYLTPELFKEMKIDTSGQFGGLGIEITIKDGILTVIVPIEGTPAYHAGLKANDKIIQIGDDLTDKMTLIEAVSKMRGKKGTPVTIYIMREGFAEPQKFTIVRDIIKIQSLRSALIDRDHGYLRIINFQERTAQDLKEALDTLDHEAKKKQGREKKTEVGLKGIVLDLRNNPGGLLDQAVRVSDLFLSKGIIVSTIGRNKDNKDIEYAHQTGTWKNVPIVVLVNGSSASASEIVAGALQDHKRAVVIGTKTFGKGSVQQVIELNDKSGLKLTVAKYYTPSGRSIHGTGLDPDIVVEPMDEETLKAQEKKNEEQKSSFWREAQIKKFKKERGGAEVDDVKATLFDKDEKYKYDYQLHEAYGYLKSYAVFKNIYAPEKKSDEK